ncbi:TonB-dependent receptor [Altererythrobacter sp.]|uniref:TonB-dependent receptor n=1 Tax=Altererythrobacter sp. TaxID=1872480 RepID=UPI001B1B6836|nr:TonB-dependent receptor [Altererythrobacter sp.]MBO6609388.1 TonB-dependent receptor [Altererythrobacter sp.]MBO6640611.1 TonB-dependent receptor [Altererythrobacter sp.]MBO6708691.1 TonB-dependent receptor [Altererythrobacter sp.]
MNKQGLYFASGIALATAMATPVSAQDAQNEEESSEISGNQIIVSALRRDESLQDTPAAVTAFTSDAIANAGIERPADFISLTSNVNLVETQNAGNAFIIIRGITQARNSEPSVAVVVDGVQQVNPAQFNQDLFDIEQIEVLKGPQGGLYGRNAIGGAIIITTKQPSDYLEGNFKAGIDNGFGYFLRGGISGPLADNVAFRIAGSYYDTDGFIDNEFLGEEADPVEDFSLRANLLVDATDQLSFDLRGSLNQLRTQALYFNIVGDVNDTSLPVRVNNPGQNDRDIYNVSLKTTYEGDNAIFTSVTSYDTLEEVLTGDAFDFLPIEESFFFNLFEFLFGPGNGFDLNQSQFLDVKAFSQEIRLESPAGAGPLNWMVGGYLIDTERYISTGNMIDTGNGVFPVFRTPSTNPLNPQFTFLADGQDNFAWALFANAGYEFSDQFRVDASLRYDRDKRKQTTLTPQGFLPNVPGVPQAQSGEIRTRVFDDWQPKITFTYEPNPDLTLYGGYSRGFRSGGFNQTGVGAEAANNGIVGVGDIFRAETADTFEAGFKAKLGPANINGAAYTTKSKNSYFFVFLADSSTQNLGNIDEVRLKGFELEASAELVPNFDVNAAIGVTYSDIKDFPDPTVLGNEAPLISRYTLNLGAQYDGPISDDIDALFRVDYRRTGKTWWEPYNTTVRNPVDLVDARVGLRFDDISVTAFAQNLFDEEYNAEFSPGGFVFKARPRRYGVEIGYEF